MAAAAPARRSGAPAPARRKPATRTKPRRPNPARTRTTPQRDLARRQPRRGRPAARPAHGRIPLVVGRTAVALGALPDSGLVFRLTRGRAWIAALSALLTGVVALNVVNLSLGAAQGRVSEQVQALQEENSSLRARLAHRLSNGRVRSTAAAYGMTSPAPRDINYRDASGEAVRLTAQRLANGLGVSG